MGLIHSPSIVSDGLVLALDAQNSRSYGGSGTTWTDIAYRGNNGTLTNGPTFEPGGPFAGSTGGSVYFDGTGDYLTVINGSFLTFTGDFTVEAWIYSSFTGGPGVQGFVLIDTRTAYTQSNWTFGVFSSGGAVQFIFSGGVLSSSVNCVSSAWNHVAVTRSGTTLKMFVNGVEGYSGTVSGTIATGSNSNATIGAGFDAANYASPGYCSNLRVVNGTALYTSAFTPPTKPLTPVSGTSLLTCQGGAIVDNSNNKFSITRNGNVRAIQSASIKFDGTNDYATIPASSDFNFGTGDVSIEAWIYWDGTYSLSGRVIYATGGSGSLDQFGIFSGYGLIFGTVYNNVAANYPPINTWSHVVSSRIGTTIRNYINGVETSSGTQASSIGNSGVTAYVGYRGADGNHPWSGNISNLRIYKGKGLTAAEVQRNFNALRNRFGI
jgi:hypothetical protein